MQSSVSFKQLTVFKELIYFKKPSLFSFEVSSCNLFVPFRNIHWVLYLSNHILSFEEAPYNSEENIMEIIFSVKFGTNSKKIYFFSVWTSSPL